MTQKRESQAEADGRQALLLVEFMVHELKNQEEGNANDFLDEVIRRLHATGFLADARSRRPRTALPASERAAAALRAVRDIARTLRDPDEEVNSSDFVDGVARRLDAAGFLAEPIKRRVYVDGIPQAVDGLFVASSEDEAIATWRDKSRRFDLARSRLMAKKPCATCGGPITHPKRAGDEPERCETCAPPAAAEDTGGTAATPTGTYRCWVRAGSPNFYRQWSVAQRNAAVAEVKRLVRAKRGEGCVESTDPRRPFETYWSMVKGKLVETAF